VPLPGKVRAIREPPLRCHHATWASRATQASPRVFDWRSWSEHDSASCDWRRARSVLSRRVCGPGIRSGSGSRALPRGCGNGSVHVPLDVLDVFTGHVRVPPGAPVYRDRQQASGAACCGPLRRTRGRGPAVWARPGWRDTTDSWAAWPCRLAWRWDAGWTSCYGRTR